MANKLHLQRRRDFLECAATIESLQEKLIGYTELHPQCEEAFLHLQKAAISLSAAEYEIADELHRSPKQIAKQETESQFTGSPISFARTV